MAIAEFERSIIQERITSGLRAAKAKGVRLGRPANLDQHEAAVRELVAKGFGVRQIGRIFNLPVSSTGKLVRRVLSAEKTSKIVSDECA